MCMNLGLQINRRAHENTALGTVQIDRSILDAAIRVLYSMPVENVSGPQKVDVERMQGNILIHKVRLDSIAGVVPLHA